MKTGENAMKTGVSLKDAERYLAVSMGACAVLRNACDALEKMLAREAKARDEWLAYVSRLRAKKTR